MSVEFHSAGLDSVDLVHVHRGPLLESVHRGSVVVVEGDEVILAAGDPGLVAYYRSTAKPFQAMALVTSGAVEQLGLDDAALAIAAGSHNAEPAQLDVVRALLEKAGAGEDDLCCGGHWSIQTRRAREQVAEVGPHAKPLPRIWSNCSGKHAGMLATAAALGAPFADYLDPEHPVQQEITRIVASLAEVEAEDVVLGVDGCGTPVHGVSLEQMARSLARFGAPSLLGEADLRTAATSVGAAMSARPDLVAGDRRFDTDLMRGARMRILSKSGAEGVQGVAVPERRLGLIVKSDDGQDRGYRQVVIELLRRLEVLTTDEADALAARHGRILKNFAGREVGFLEVVL